VLLVAGRVILGCNWDIKALQFVRIRGRAFLFVCGIIFQVLCPIIGFVMQVGATSVKFSTKQRFE
jgi:hypothetical protein